MKERETDLVVSYDVLLHEVFVQMTKNVLSLKYHANKANYNIQEKVKS